ncbi:MAG: hypothetical protein WCJ84_04595 [Candidatus Peregrinibacteria bacterium]
MDKPYSDAGFFVFHRYVRCLSKLGILTQGEFLVYLSLLSAMNWREKNGALGLIWGNRREILQRLSLHRCSYSIFAKTWEKLVALGLIQKISSKKWRIPNAKVHFTQDKESVTRRKETKSPDLYTKNRDTFLESIEKLSQNSLKKISENEKNELSKKLILLLTQEEFCVFSSSPNKGNKSNKEKDEERIWENMGYRKDS